MSELASALVDFELTAVVVGLAVAAVWDGATREVPDRLWQALAVIGAALGAGLLAGDGGGPVLVWLLVAGFALEHLFPWDERWDGGSARLPQIIEIVLYVGTGAVVFLGGWAYGFGGGGVPIAAAATYAAVLVARGLFEARILYGGADAKAVITLGVLLPVWATPFLGQPAGVAPLGPWIPFALTALINAAVLTLAVPVVLGVQNARCGEFSFPRGFLGCSIPVDELAHRFVWLDEPTTREGTPREEFDTAEEDHRLRVQQAEALRARGIERVWVAPQIPLVLFLALGAGLGLLFGNIVLDLVALL